MYNEKLVSYDCMHPERFYKIGKEIIGSSPDIESVSSQKIETLIQAYSDYFKSLAITLYEGEERNEDREDILQAGRVAFWQERVSFKRIIGHLIGLERSGNTALEEHKKILYRVFSAKIREAMEQEREEVKQELSLPGKRQEQGIAQNQETALILARGLRAAQQETDPDHWNLFMRFEVEGVTLNELSAIEGKVKKKRLSQRVSAVRERIKRKISPDELSAEEVERYERLRWETEMKLRSLKAELKRIPDHLRLVSRKRAEREKAFESTSQEGSRLKDELALINSRIREMEEGLLKHQTPLSLEESILGLEAEISQLQTRQVQLVVQVQKFEKKVSLHEERTLRPLLENIQALKKKERKITDQINQLKGKLRTLELPKPASAPPVSFGSQTTKTPLSLS